MRAQWTLDPQLCNQTYYAPVSHAGPSPHNPCTWITTHLPTHEGWMAELALPNATREWGSGTGGLTRGLGTLPQGDQEPLIVKDKDERPTNKL